MPLLIDHLGTLGFDFDSHVMLGDLRSLEVTVSGSSRCIQYMLQGQPISNSM